MSHGELWLNGALVGAVVWGVGMTFLLRKMYALSFGSLPIVILVTGIGLLAWTFWRSAEAKARVVLSACSIIFSLYIVEGSLYWWFDSNAPDAFIAMEHRVAEAKAAGIDYDTRTKLDVIRDLRDTGVKAYPSVAPIIFAESDGVSGVEEGTLFPFGGISSAKTVFCNEAGTWSVYESDEHGFNNPPGTFETERADIALIGDSFTQGACVGPSEDVASQLRQVRAGGETVLNMGAWGNGPLLELAVLKEYVRPLRPRKVVWLYYEHNDLEGRGLLTELKSPTLRRYLKEKGFTQHLAARQGEVDSLLRRYVAEEERKLAVSEGEQEQVYSKAFLPGIAWFLHTAIALRDLKALRSSEGYQWGGANTTGVSRHEWLRRILGEARDEVASWGGELYFVYLPTWARYSPFANQEELYDRREILALVEDLGLPVIDFHERIAAHPDPRAFFPLHIHGHYTPEGYRLLAEEISLALGEPP